MLKKLNFKDYKDKIKKYEIKFGMRYLPCSINPTLLIITRFY